MQTPRQYRLFIYWQHGEQMETGRWTRLIVCVCVGTLWRCYISSSSGSVCACVRLLYRMYSSMADRRLAHVYLQDTRIVIYIYI